MDNELKNKIRSYIEAHTDEMLSDISELVSIDSVRTTLPDESDALPGAPFGEGVRKALDAARDMCAGYGLKTREYGGRVVSADMGGGESRLDILAHMDVVKAGDGWSVTEAFKPLVRDGCIYGRGTSDDKGPAVAALYAMRAVIELGIPITGRCRLILGGDEESGMADMPAYYGTEDEAPMTFSPDAEFPLINIEKGQFRGTVRTLFAHKSVSGTPQGGVSTAGSGVDAINSDSNCGGRGLVYAKSGDTINVVPENAIICVEGFTEAELEAALGRARKSVPDEFSADICEDAGSASVQTDGNGGIRGGVDSGFSVESGRFIIRIKGKNAHASKPENGVNAAVIMTVFLGELAFTDSRLSEMIAALKRLFPYGDHFGRALGINMSDNSGATTVSPNILEIDETGIRLRFDARTVVSADWENTVKRAGDTIRQAGFEFEPDFKEPHAVDADSDFIMTLLEAYTMVTGKTGKCLAIGGGTYVHDLKRGVAFGAVGETTDTHMHGANEFMSIAELQDAAVIYALAIAELCA